MREPLFLLLGSEQCDEGAGLLSRVMIVFHFFSTLYLKFGKKKKLGWVEAQNSVCFIAVVHSAERQTKYCSCLKEAALVCDRVCISVSQEIIYICTEFPAILISDSKPLNMTKRPDIKDFV